MSKCSKYFSGQSYGPCTYHGVSDDQVNQANYILSTMADELTLAPLDDEAPKTSKKPSAHQGHMGWLNPRV